MQETSLRNEETQAWAREVLAQRIAAIEKARKRILKGQADSQNLHRIRTRARRLRCALDDLAEILPGKRALHKRAKELGEETGRARDTEVLLQRLRGYRRTTLLGRAEIQRLNDELQRKAKRRRKRAHAAVNKLDLDPRA